jgi:hypothetical protein
MKSPRALFGGLAVLLAAVGNAGAQTSYPMITHTSPVAVQRGKEATVTVSGRMNFFGVYRALFEGTGISAAGLPPPPPATAKKTTVTSVKLKLKVAADAPLGVRDFRLASTLGVSSVGQLLVVDVPVVEEKGKNNAPATANPIATPCVVCGRIEAAEDVDYFKFHADAGQTFTFEAHCARLQDRIHDLQKHADPILVLSDATGRELAANDDFYFADPLLRYTFEKAGDYFIQVRDSKYDGDPRWVYALVVTPAPYASQTFPMAGNPGQQVKVAPVGSAALTQREVTLTLPKEEGIHTLELNVKGQKTNPVAFVVSSLPQVIEQEPNDEPAKAMRVQIPCGINGRIGVPRDLDHFVFKGQKGKAVRLEVKARRFGTVLQSSLDSVLDVMTPAGRVLATNDDANGKDAALVFTPPADGDYVIRLRDLNSKGGETAVYYLEADRAVPNFTLRCDPDKAMIGPGGSATWFVHVARISGFTGPVKVEIKGLPQGVSASELTIPPTMTQGIVVLTADANASHDVADVQIVGTAMAKGIDGKERMLVRRATPQSEIYFPGGGRGVFDVAQQTVSLTDPSDILKVEVIPKELKLKPGQEVRLDVTVQRRADYTKGVSLDVNLSHLGRVFGSPLPPGVTVVTGKSKTLLGTGSKGHIVLKAAPNAAPIEGVPLSVLAHVSVNFVVKVSYSSPAIRLSVAK